MMKIIVMVVTALAIGGCSDGVRYEDRTVRIARDDRPKEYNRIEQGIGGEQYAQIEQDDWVEQDIRDDVAALAARGVADTRTMLNSVTVTYALGSHDILTSMVNRAEGNPDLWDERVFRRIVDAMDALVALDDQEVRNALIAMDALGTLTIQEIQTVWNIRASWDSGDPRLRR